MISKVIFFQIIESRDSELENVSNVHGIYLLCN